MLQLFHKLFGLMFYFLFFLILFSNRWKGSKQLQTKIMPSLGSTISATSITSSLDQTSEIISPSTSTCLVFTIPVYPLIQMSPLHKTDNLVHVHQALCKWRLDKWKSACIWHLVSHCYIYYRSKQQKVKLSLTKEIKFWMTEDC